VRQLWFFAASGAALTAGIHFVRQAHNYFVALAAVLLISALLVSVIAGLLYLIYHFEVENIIRSAHSGDFSISAFPEIYDSPNNICVVARDEQGRIVGCACVVTGSDESRFARPEKNVGVTNFLAATEGRLTRVGVLPEFGRTGVGSTLSKRCIEFARERGLRGLMLTATSVQAPAVRMYARQGFNLDKGTVGSRILGVEVFTMRMPLPC